MNEIKQIEDHLFKTDAGEDAVVFEAKLILDAGLHEKLLWQKSVYALVNEYGRGKLKKELEAVHRKLFHEPEHESFRKKIFNIFTNL